jgi:hypothetical protein
MAWPFWRWPSPVAVVTSWKYLPWSWRNASVGEERAVARVPVAEVEVEPAVVVEVAEVGAHHQHDALEPHLLRDVGERAVAVVADEPAVGDAEILAVLQHHRADLGDRLAIGVLLRDREVLAVRGRPEVEVAVVVEVEEPRRERHERAVDPGLAVTSWNLRPPPDAATLRGMHGFRRRHEQ